MFQGFICKMRSSLYIKPFAVFLLQTLLFVHTNQFRRPHRITPETYVLKSSEWLNDSRFYPDIGNGFIGTQLFSESVFASGLYNGAGSKSHRARIQYLLPYAVRPYTDSNWNIELNMYDAIVKLNHKNVNKSLKIQQLIYVHRSYVNLIVTEIIVEKFSSDCFMLELFDFSGEVSKDLTLLKRSIRLSRSDNVFSTCLCTTSCSARIKASLYEGRTKVAESNKSSTLPVYIVASDWPKYLHLRNKWQKFVFIQSVAFTANQALHNFRMGLSASSRGVLTSLHTCAWRKLWNNRALVDTDDIRTSQSIIGSFYYILSSLPHKRALNRFKFFGISPGGISHGGNSSEYLGHVFWDQEFWMLPPLLPFFPEYAKLIIQYRVRNLQQALQKARYIGYRGAAFPWETARTGIDVCPGQQYIFLEIHNTGDIIYLLQQYLYITGDYTIFNERVCYNNQSHRKTKKFSCSCSSQPSLLNCFTAWDLLRETACFWTSRSFWNSTLQRYVINDVMGPDEFHFPVDNSAFTNGVAAKNLDFASSVAHHFNICRDKKLLWKQYYNYMFLPYDTEMDFHPQFSNFNLSTIGEVKQADTIMLGYPLGVKMTQKTQVNDLHIYSDITSTNGPAMTSSMFSINWLEVDYKQRADESYLKQLKNKQEPFSMWCELTDKQGSVNFLTGIGGHLQSVVYGYFGMRIMSNSLHLRPQMIPSANGEVVEKMELNNVRYLSKTFNLLVNRTHCQFSIPNSLNSVYKRNCFKIYSINYKQVGLICKPGEVILFNTDRFAIFVV